MNVLVTGLGLIGSWVVKHLIIQGHTPTIFDVAAPSPWSRDVLESMERVPFVQGDITDLPDLLDAIKHSRAEAVIHTAGLLTQAVRQRPYAGIRINFLGSVNVLEAVRMLGGGRVVFCSSSTVYTGVWEKYPGSVVPADFAMNVVRDRPRSVYATAKLAMEWLGLNYQDAQYLDFVAVRFQGVIGPWAGPLNAIPPRILKAIVEPAVRGEHVRIDDPMIVWKGVEEFVHASDAALGATLAATAPDVQDRVYSIGMGRAYSLAEIVDIGRALFPGVRIEVAITPTGGIAGYPAVRHQACDAGAAQRDLGFVPQFDMRAAMEDYAQWYRQHLATGRR